MFNEIDRPYDSELKAFGANWCGPEHYPHGEDVLVARYPKETDDDGKGDGQSVDVYCCAMPARFYILKVKSEPNSIGDNQDAFEVRTGSSEAKTAAIIAEKVASGMLGFYSIDK